MKILSTVATIQASTSHVYFQTNLFRGISQLLNGTMKILKILEGTGPLGLVWINWAKMAGIKFIKKTKVLNGDNASPSGLSTHSLHPEFQTHMDIDMVTGAWKSWQPRCPCPWDFQVIFICTNTGELNRWSRKYPPKFQVNRSYIV